MAEGRLDLTVRAERAVLPDGLGPATVGVRNGRIVAVAERADAPWEAVLEVTLQSDEVLLPGLVDTHVHVNEPGRTAWEGFATATRAAAAGGITTIVDMPLNSIPPTVDLAALEAKRSAATGQCFVDVGFWGGAVPGNLADLAALHGDGVFGFTCFLIDSGVPEFAPLDPAGFGVALAETARLGALMVVHAEDPERVGDAAAGPDYRDFLASRPKASEEAAIAGLIEAMRRTGAAAHVLHLSDADPLSLVRVARAEGLRLTVETCGHYLTFCAEQIPPGHTAYKCCPPIRDEGNRERLWRGLGEGLIDLVVSDHSPSPPELKAVDTGDFGQAWGGISGLQVSLPAVWTGARERGFTLGDVVGWMATAPAALVGLERKGALAVGVDADLVAFAPDEAFAVEPERLHHRHRLTPWAGQTLTGVVRHTWLRGRRVDGVPRGRLLRRGHR